MFKNIVVLFIIFISSTSASKILVIVPTPAYSHQVALQPIWKELSSRGHQITLATPDPIKDPTLTNITEIDMKGTYSFMSEFYRQIDTASKLKILNTIQELTDTCMELQLSKYLKKFIKRENLFDLVIVESMVTEYVAFADLYNCPRILISSFEVVSMVYGYLGNPTNPVAYPDMVLPFIAGKLNFQERFTSFVFNNLYYAYKYLFVYPKRQKILQKHFGEDVRGIEELYSDVDLLMTNVHPAINDIKPFGPNTVSFGGGNHLLPKKKLPQDLQEYLDNAKEGCIYFSLGSNTKSSNMKAEKIQIIMNAFSELPYKILWKFELEDGIVPAKNVKLISWAPQQDVLRHPNIKLFVTQGGMQSLEESILSGVPMVMMPMYGDQEANAKRMEYKGISKIVPHAPLPNKEQFKKAVLEVITDPKYKQNVIKIAELLVDNPINGVDKAVWWIEYVIRHKGAKHLRNPSIDIPFYQYFCLDVIATIVFIIFIIFKILSYILRLANSLIFRKKSYVSDKNKKRQ